MKNSTFLSKNIILGIALALSFLSCEKDEVISGEGNYIYTISNLSNTSRAYNVYVDGEYKGIINAESGSVSGYTKLCGDMAFAESQPNVIVIKNLKQGKHTLKLEDVSTKRILHTEHFIMKSDECMCQPYNMM